MILVTDKLIIVFSVLSVRRHLILCKQIESDTERESDLQVTLDWERKWFVDFECWKNLFHLTSLTTLVLLM